jgi:hypothetical protein
MDNLSAAIPPPLADGEQTIQRRFAGSGRPRDSLSQGYQTPALIGIDLRDRHRSS